MALCTLHPNLEGVARPSALIQALGRGSSPGPSQPLTHHGWGKTAGVGGVGRACWLPTWGPAEQLGRQLTIVAIYRRQGRLGPLSGPALLS